MVFQNTVHGSNFFLWRNSAGKGARFSCSWRLLCSLVVISKNQRAAASMSCRTNVQSLKVADLLSSQCWRALGMPGVGSSFKRVVFWLMAFAAFNSPVHVLCTMYYVPCTMYHVLCTMYHDWYTSQPVDACVSADLDPRGFGSLIQKR